MLSSYLVHLAVERGLAANTLASYRRDLLRYVGHLRDRGRVTFGEVAEADVTAFLTALSEGDGEHRALAAGSAARAVSAVRGLHRFALREGVSGHDPAGRVRPPRRLRPRPRAMDVGEVERLIAASGPAGAPLTLRNRALLELLYGTGARISEAVGLTVDDVDLVPDASQARLRGKDGRTRAVPLGRPGADAVEAYLTAARPGIAAHGRGGRSLLLNARGGGLTRQGAWEVLQAAAERAGLAGVSPHVLRHSFAAHLLAGGADAGTVHELLGHAPAAARTRALAAAERLREVYTAAHPRAR
ncbi:tyrosine recombinase XerD [Planomonospora parontospora subsp. parontospora]|uniref:Tyrosine recombinase XerD n=2 Tax=Planomonospora parontospora TaxID=58119 RepID=A0AA37BBZ3_9ACTN|nr:tyrosine recombinase [Planomonospora parontospora]GGK48773.1 tyrosine recombinase XerD [Planomonospora parontospora]GII06741.1 tyrosine recombinase XerD [Planomonospora parontospora subsp. parontospora]